MRETGKKVQKGGRYVWRYRVKKLTAVLLAVVLFAGTAAPALAETIPADAETRIGEAYVRDEALTETPVRPEELLPDPAGETVETAPEAESVGVGEVKSGICGEDGADVRWEFKDGVLTISGTGAMDYYYVMRDFYTGEIIEENIAPWETFKDQVKKVVVEEGVTEVSTTAFPSMFNLETVVIAGSVKSIGMQAFVNAGALKNIELGEGIETIYDDAFYGAALKTLKLPSTLNYLAGDAFTGLFDLQNFKMDSNSGAFSVKNGILYDNKNVLVSFPAGRTGTFIIPEGVVGIEKSAFIYSNLSKLIISDTVSSLGSYAFYNSQLEEIEFSGSLETIPQSACWYALKLNKITLKEDLKTISSGAFGDTSLSRVVLPSTIEAVSGTAFDANTELIFTGEELFRIENGDYIQAVMVDIESKELYSCAFEVLDLINKERAKEGLEALAMDTSLLDSAMQRADEMVIFYSHERPSGAMCITANSRMYGENIAMGQSTPEEVMNVWMSSEGHRGNILGSGYKSVGIGCVNLGYQKYWVQCFGFDEADEALRSDYNDSTAVRTVTVKKDDAHFNPDMAVFGGEMAVGDVRDVMVSFSEYRDVYFKPKNAVIKSDNPEVIRVDGTGIVGQKVGKARISLYYKGAEDKALTKEICVYKNPDALYAYIKDVNDFNAYYYRPVHWAYAYGVTNGCGDYFKPNKTCTRAEAVTFLYNVAGKPAVSGDSPFADIKDKKVWYYKAVLWAQQNGITSGFGKDANDRALFRPNVLCSRAMIVTMIRNYAKNIDGNYQEVSGSTKPFPDVETDAWYCNTVRWALENGIANGKGNGLFCPDENCTRAQIVTFLYHYVG